MMGRNHIRVLSEMKDVDLVGISDVFEENLERSKKYCSNAYLDYKEMIEKEKPDIVSIVTPTKLHKEIALYLIDKGINILIEKPIADTVENALEIKAAALKKGIKVTVGHIERFNPAVQELKSEIEKGKLGKPYKIDVHRVGPFPARIRDVGVVVDLAVHDIDIIRYILGSEVDRIYAEVEREIHTSNEDMLSAILKMKNKTVCHLNINWLTPKKERKIHVTGEKGLFIADYLNRSLYLYENDYVNSEDYNSRTGNFTVNEGKMIKYNTQDHDLLEKEIQNFVDAVRNNKEPLVTIDDGIKALDIAHKILESANKHEVVRCLDN